MAILQEEFEEIKRQKFKLHFDKYPTKEETNTNFLE